VRPQGALSARAISRPRQARGRVWAGGGRGRASAAISPASGRACVKFAVREQSSDGWVDLGGVEIA
jgi:hypothetical protein